MRRPREYDGAREARPRGKHRLAAAAKRFYADLQ